MKQEKLSLPTTERLPRVKKLAYLTSLLRYDAMSHFLRELQKAKAAQDLLDAEELEFAINAIDKAWEISEKHMDKAANKKHGTEYKELLNKILVFKDNDKILPVFIFRLAVELNEQAEADFKRGYKKLYGIMLTKEHSAVRSLKRAAGWVL